MGAQSVDSVTSCTVYLLAISSTNSLSSPSRTAKRNAMVSLHVIHRSLSSSSPTSPDIVSKGFMAALPYLLSINMKSVVMKSARVLGDMALSSYQSALQIAYDKTVIRALLQLLMVKDAGIVIEACHVITNLSACSLGKTALCDAGAVLCLLLLISMIAETITKSQVGKSISLNVKWHGLPQNQEDMLFEILDTLNALTQNAFCECMRRIPKGQHAFLLQRFQVLWKNISYHGHLVRDKIHVLCKAIVWLAMEQDEILYSDGEVGEVLSCLFGGMKDDFKHFWHSHWEICPFFMENAKHVEHETQANLFGKGWASGKDNIDIKEFMTGALACPLFSGDEIETSNVFEEIEENLGKPLLFDQDVRLVKSIHTGIGTVKEIDYHKVTSTTHDRKDPLIFADINTCVDAYNSGYTLALRGIEFRSPQVAKLAEELAVWFGQVTVGANMYLTPSGAQGFKSHADDHCVFVWQIIGSKAWKIWSSRDELPRLYTQHVEVCNTYQEDTWNVMLNEGSVLYIPRGFPHEASTEKQILKPLTPCFGCNESNEHLTNDPKWKDSLPIIMQESESFSNSRAEVNIASQTVLTDINAKTDYEYSQKRLKDYHQASERNMNESLHITFGVEVERPFDWEGFVHMSLHSWAENQNWSDILGKSEASSVTSTKRSGELFTGLLHIAVRSCGDKCFTFRKACLVAAKPLLSRDQKIDIGKLESFFQSLIVYVGKKADFKEAFDILLSAIDRREGSSLDWMCWLRHLPCEGKPNVWSEPVTFFYERLMDYRSGKMLQDLEAGFVNAMSNFVSSGSFSEAYDLFVSLLYKYRDIRKRYINGMLALQV